MNSITQFLSAHRAFKNTLISLCIFGIILVILPFSIQWGAQYALKQQGANNATIDDINLNVFTGQFELLNLTATFNQQPPLLLKRVFVDMDMAALFSSQIVIEKALIDGLKAQVTRDKHNTISINGYQPPLSKDDTAPKAVPADAEPLDFAVHSFSLINSHLDYFEDNFEQNIKVKKISLNQLVSWTKEMPAHISVDLKESNSHLQAELDATLLTDVITLNGELDIKGLTSKPYLKFYQPHIEALNADVNVNIHYQLALGERLKGNVTHDVALSNVQVLHQQLKYSLANMNTTGKTILDGSNVVIRAQLELLKSQLVDTQSSTLLKSVKSVTIDDVRFDSDNMSFKSLTLAGIDLLGHKQQPKLLSLEALTLQQLNFNFAQSSIHLKHIELQKPLINATLSEQKKLTHLALIEPILKRFQTAPIDTPNNEPKKPSTPIIINIEQVRLTKPGLLNFNDLSVSPNYSTTLHFNTIDIEQLSSEKPADFKLALKQGEYTTIDITGQGLLFNPAEQLSYTIDIKQLDLPPVSSYTSQAMGYGIKSGIIDTVIKGSIKQQQIDTNVTLKIDSIEVVETNKETAAEISGASGMSIGLALSTLQDKNNIIDLELPIGGDIKKPDFDLSLIINKAMGIAMKAATFGYLKLALEPFSSLVSLFNIANDAASSISLAPIAFKPNDTRLVAKQKELLDKVSNILNERPGIKIKTCSIASLGDQNSIKEQLLALKKQAYLAQLKGKKVSKKQQTIALKKITVADKDVQQALKTLANTRSALIKTYLTSVKKVDSARILNCLSAENLTKDSKSVVELII